MTFGFAVKTTGFPPKLPRRDTFFGGENPEDGTGPGPAEDGRWTLIAAAFDVSGAIPVVLGLILPVLSEVVDFMRPSCCSRIEFGSELNGEGILLYCFREGDNIFECSVYWCFHSRFQLELPGCVQYCMVDYLHNLLMCCFGCWC